MLLIFGAMALFLSLSVPIFAVLGISAAVGIWERGLRLITLPQNVFESLDSFALLAVPFYILAGAIMRHGGISDRLITLAAALVGWVRGGMGSAAILTCMFFSTMSGASSATVAAVGGTLVPAMVKRRYSRPFSAATVAVGSELGAILPPSMPMVIYGLAASTSIGDLFIAGILPGIFIGLTLMATVMVVARVQDFDPAQRVPLRQWLRNVWQGLIQSFLALLMPVIIIGGIYSGAFTATEAAVVAVLYGFFLAGVVYRRLTPAILMQILSEAAIATGVVMLIVAFAAVLGFSLTVNRIPQILGQGIVAISDNPIVFLLLVNVLLFIVGTFMEALATILILGPILAPIAVGYGIHPTHFGMIMIVNIAIGMITPPVAVNLAVASQVSGVPVDAMTRPLIVFLIVMVLNVLIITYVPWLSLALL